uniref:Gypsy retrotransposon integrase-like protein 1 n=1 Tax=Takifugu rubripes TaxID=31033 RepID=A0A674P0I3_TAKRU
MLDNFQWSEDCADAFKQLRSALVGAPVLSYPDPQLPFIVDTDASNVGLGAVLSQEGENEQVIAYYSRSLNRPERNYCVTRRELLAVVLGLRHFRPYLYGRRLLLRTNHASLTWLLNFKEPGGQLARWLETLQDYDFEIRHRPGRHYANADALSRRPCEMEQCRYCQRVEDRGTANPTVSALQPLPLDDESGPQVSAQTTAVNDGLETVDLQQLQLDQSQDPVLSRVQDWIETGQRPAWNTVSALDPETKALYSQWTSLIIRDGLLHRRWQTPGGHRDIFQLLVPRQLRPRVLQLIHGSVGAGHFGVTKTLHRLRSRFYWPGCRQDVELYVHRCDPCTVQKGPTRRSHAPLQQYQVGAPMERVGVDILGPFPTTDQGNRYVLVAMDYFTKWPEAYAVPDQSASTTAEHLVNEMFCRFRVPEELHSDQGRNFEAKVFSEVCRRLGIKKTRTTPLHPQSDGLVERFNHTLATQLAILTSRQQRDWDQHLPLVLWAYRTAVQESTKCTPAVLMFGHELRTPVDLVFGSPPEPELEGAPGLDYLHSLRKRLQLVHEMTRKALSDAGLRQKRAYDSRCRGQDFAPGEQVWVDSPERKKGLSPKLMGQWVGPCTVLERLSDVVYRVRLVKRNRVVVLHRDRLAPYRHLAQSGGDLHRVCCHGN